MWKNNTTKFDWNRFWAPINIQIYEQGFLIDPESIFGNKQIVSFDKILEMDISCLILLGNPGLGKSYALWDMYLQLKNAGMSCLLYDFKEYNSFQTLTLNLESEKIFQEWINGEGLLYLFLDSLDEGQLEIKKLEYELSRYLIKLPFSRLRFYVTCRSADLPPNFLSLMESIWSDKDGLNSNVQIYQLAQLREQDVYGAAQQFLNTAAKEFIEAVYETSIEAFASHPVTLDMLFRIFAARKALPDNRKDIYELGCKELISDLGNNSEANELFKIAEQIGLLSVVANRHRLYTGSDYQFDDNTLNIRDMFVPEQLYQYPEKMFNDVLQTALFVSSGSKFHFFAHRTYGEYLAASCLRESSITFDHIKNLFTNPKDPYQKIAPKLNETAAWLASMRSDVSEWLMRSHPSVLVHSDSVVLTSFQKSTLIEYFVQQYNTEGPLEDRLDWNGFQRLDYPEIGIQLKTYLEDISLAERAKELAMQFVVYCNIASIDHTLIAIALDAKMTNSLRVGALAALARPSHRAPEISQLRVLLLKPSEYLVDRYLYKKTIEVLWPNYLTAEELFNNLRLPSFKELSIGSPDDDLLSNLLLEDLHTKDLPIALEWVSKNSQENDAHLTHSAQEFIARIMQLAWDNLDNEPIRLGFARAAWQRLIHYNPVISSHIPYLYEQNQVIRNYDIELQNNIEKRHQLLISMLDVLTPKDLLREDLLALLLRHHATIPFVVPDDITWLLEQTQNQAHLGKLKAYEYLTKITVFSTKEDLLEDIYSRYIAKETHPFADDLRAIINQCTAVNKTRLEETKRSDEQWQKEQEINRVSVETIVRKAIGECQSNSLNWHDLTIALLTGDYGGIQYRIWDLRTANGWKYIEDDAQALGEILASATKFVKDYNLANEYIYISANSIDEQLAEAGFRAFMLLAAMDKLNQITQLEWEKWAKVIISITPHFSSDLHVLDDILLQNVSIHAQDVVLSWLANFINSSSEDDSLYFLLRRYRHIQSDKLFSLLLEHIKKLSLEDRKFFILFDYLAGNSKSARKAQEFVLQSFENLKPIENTRSVLFAAKIIQFSTNNYWWDLLYPYLEHNTHITDLVFHLLAINGGWRDNRYLEHLTPTQLATLYKLALNVNPYSSDREFHGGTVPDWYTRQEWRDTILKEVANRGTNESVELLNSIYSEAPETPNIRYLIETARYKFRLESWEAPDSKDILQILVNSKQHYIRNADQLTELVIQLIQSIEQEFRGTATMQRSVWDKTETNWQPVEEEAFSDAIAHWLTSRTSSIIVNREVEVRKDTTKPKGDRTDIIIQALNDNQERLVVIIEVKGCWYRELYGHLQTQLVDQYITPHPECNHGIYLVGHFASHLWLSSSKQKMCRDRDKATLENKLQETITNLRLSKPTVIRGIVFDASLAAE